MRGASTLKSVSRRRSLVGRVLIPGGAASVRERKVPAMMRIANQHNGSAFGVRHFRIELRTGTTGLWLVGSPSRKPGGSSPGRLPLQSVYAWLVNPAGPMDGRGDARPHLLPSAG